MSHMSHNFKDCLAMQSIRDVSSVSKHGSFPFRQDIVASTLFTDTHEYVYCNETVKVSGCGFASSTGELLVVGIGDATNSLHMSHRLQLPIIKVRFSQHLSRQPVTPKGNDE